MDDHIQIHNPMLLTAIGTMCFLLLTPLPLSNCQEEHEIGFSVCSRPFNCGSLSSITYPFWGGERPRYCGGSDQLFQLNCGVTPPIIDIGSQKFHVLGINPVTYTMNMFPEDIPLYRNCSAPLSSYTLNSTPFHYNQIVYNITIFYDCPRRISYPVKNFTCKGNPNRYGFYEEETLLDRFPGRWNCGRSIQVQALRKVSLDPNGGFDALEKALEGEREVSYTIEDGQRCRTCLESDGICGTNERDTNQFSCYCPDGSGALSRCSAYASTPTPSRHNTNTLNVTSKIAIGVGVAVITGLLICVTICCFKGMPSISQGKFWLTTKSNQDIEDFLRSHGALTLKRYKFLDMKKMTNSFKVKLGEGGFGVVYKGKLLTGCPVAIKILNSSKGIGEEFINEVASISRTSHVNVVTLLGFCLEGRKKALMYEFMSNGSLEKFIYKKGPEANISLSWETLYQIAIGIARGLEYLHKGCNTRILHFDIKPHNILLDENFCPKISDFGLAKLCPRRESIISMSNARGTIGYVAPEVCNRHFGGVSHKSDVYSYGMLLLDMVGERNNTNAEANHSSEIYFPQWIYKRLEQGTHLEPDGVMAIEENEIAKKMTVVGLWCIQTFPNDRPTMSRVIDMLEGNMNSLEMPPKPIMTSPARSALESSTTSTC